MLDLAALRLSRSGDGTVVAARTGDGEVLARVTVDAAVSDASAAFAVFDAALAGAFVSRVTPTGELVSCPVGLFNPYSQQVSVGPVPSTVVYDLPGAVFAPSGLVVAVDGDVLLVDGAPVAPVAVSAASTAQACAAHPDPTR